MARSRSSKRTTTNDPVSPLIISLDEESKRLLTKAAELRRIGVNDYVRTVTVAQARKEVLASREQTISLTPEEQLSFWRALGGTSKLTAAQKRLSKVMRNES
jgi:uncharacterized protein (DUF1778 family)